MSSENKAQNPNEQNPEHEKLVNNQPSIEGQQKSQEELTEEELEKIAGGFRRAGR
ncbi:bacteriocin [Coleofasciculus sp. F4-SAH-05]|uniref:bacteriocin n=1 Tax=unclassified Coleofasciculus TaxID=2692782 RepID=UPI0032FE3210